MTRRHLAGLRLLVVEDEALVAMLIEDTLVDLGCVVLGPAASAAEAWSILRHEPIDGVLLDVNLGGGEQSYPIADVLAGRGVPFVFVTGYGDRGPEAPHAQVAVLQKPFDAPALERIVAENLAAPRRRRGTP